MLLKLPYAVFGFILLDVNMCALEDRYMSSDAKNLMREMDLARA